MRSGQSSRGDRQCENSLEILHSHPTRLVHPSTTPPGEVRCLPPTTTCPLVCEATNPIRPLYTASPIHYSTLIPTPHHSSFATCSLPSFYLKTSRHPSAQPTRTLAAGTLSRPSPRHSLLTPQNTPPAHINSPLHCCIFRPDASIFYTIRRVRQRTSSLVPVSCTPAVCTLPSAPAETARDETVPAWKPSCSGRSHHLLYTCIHYLTTPRQYTPRRLPTPHAIVKYGNKRKPA